MKKAQLGLADLLVAQGRDLCRYTVEEQGEHALRVTCRLPESIQYAVLDEVTGRLHVACSDGGPHAPGQRHLLISLDVRDGRLQVCSTPRLLPSRPIHIALDLRRARLAVVYNREPGLSLFALEADGGVGALLAQGLSAGAFYPHQVFFLKDDGLCVVCRGANQTATAAELPGSLRTYDVDGFSLREREVIAPRDGSEFGPRNAIADPVAPRLYLSVERQNRLVGLSYEGRGFAPHSVFDLSSLSGPTSFDPQMAGPIRLHPFLRVLYQVNRTHMTSGSPQDVYDGSGENTLVAYALDPSGGAPTEIQRIATGGVHPRTLSLDDSGRLLAVGNVRQLQLQRGGANELIVPSVCIFSVDPQGRLRPVSQIFPTAGDGLVFWSSFISAIPIARRAHAD